MKRYPPRKFGNDLQKKGRPILSRLLMLVIIALVLGVAVIIVSRIASFASVLTSVTVNNPLSNAINVKFSTYGNVTRTMVVIENSNSEIVSASLFIHNQENAEMVHYYIPGWVYMTDYSSSFDNAISVKNLIYAGNTINQNRKYEYALWQLNNLSGVTVDSYIIINERSMSVLNRLGVVEKDLDINTLNADKVEGVLKKLSVLNFVLQPDDYTELLTNISSNLSILSLNSRVLSLQNALSGKVYRIDLSEKSLLRDSVTKTGEQISIANISSIDQKLQERSSVLRSRDLQREQVKIEVYNGSTVAKAAERYARRVANSGCFVLRYGNSPEPSTKTKIIVLDQEKYAESLRLVKDIFVLPGEIENVRPAFMTTGDIIIILGDEIKSEVKWN